MDNFFISGPLWSYVVVFSLALIVPPQSVPFGWSGFQEPYTSTIPWSGTHTWGWSRLVLMLTIEGIDIWRFNTAVEYNHLVLLCNVNLHCSATLWLTAYSDNIVICMSLGVHTKCLVPNFVTGELLYVLMNKNWPDKVSTPHGWAIVFWQSSLSPQYWSCSPWFSLAEQWFTWRRAEQSSDGLFAGRAHCQGFYSKPVKKLKFINNTTFPL